MTALKDILTFKGSWRSYQARILKRADEYAADGKIHIVAAPGSGKTTLGIELIRRFDRPCLILSPSITIRQQWIARMTEGFLADGQEADDWFSNDIRAPKPITAITYQALHSCMKHFAGVLKEQDDTDEENDPASRSETVDYTDFDLMRTVREAGFGCLCLDEAHHLRSEWWKALESFRKEFPDMKIIALTATPPYDSTPAQWKRYLDLCGPIDEEIFTPELVREGSLCPHQDYIFFNQPSKAEQAAVRQYQEQARSLMEELRNDREFVRLVAAHRGILSPREYSEQFLDNPRYFSSLLIFLQDRGVPFSPYLRDLTGTKARLPRLDVRWMEALLQGFLYDDTEAYPCDAVYREQLILRLKEAGCIYRRQVSMAKNEEITKILMKSSGKLDSIARIVESEYQSLGSELRLLVLCDFIRKEALSSLEDADASPGEIGAVPIFRYLYQKQQNGPRLGVLSGSVVIIPGEAEEAFRLALAARGSEGSARPLGNTGYSLVSVRGSGHHTVAVITELFAQGYIQALIGTKSLLGEGWDSPCINTLILATYVGSFMLSNQMRGRAIRTWASSPHKVSNIWHLACVTKQEAADEASSETLGDYETLTRRFQSFLGVSYDETTIESGIERLKLTVNPASRRSIEKENQRMLQKAADREGLRRLWEKSLQEIHGDMRVEEMTAADKEALDLGYLFLNAVALEIVAVLGAFLFLGLRLSLCRGLQLFDPLSLLLSLGFFASLLLLCRYGIRLFSLCTPQKRIRRAAEGVLDALRETGRLEMPEHCAVGTLESEFLTAAYLKGGSTRDKTLLAACLAELLAPVDNPRYLLLPGRGRRVGSEVYSVPEIFGRKKEDAEIFANCMRRFLGPCRCVYTRTPEGRQTLLKARSRSFFNRNHRVIEGKKQVKGEFE